MVMTFALLYAMQGLIHLQPGAEGAARIPNIVPWIKADPPEPTPPPPRPDFTKHDLTHTLEPPTVRPVIGTGTGIPIVLTRAHPGPVGGFPDKLRDPDGPLIAIVRVEPTYPGVAQQKGLEGWVDVRFDVMTSGLVTNIEVISSSNRVFEKAAIKAVQRFRFKAPVADGQPQIATGIEYRFRFDMSD